MVLSGYEGRWQDLFFGCEDGVAFEGSLRGSPRSPILFFLPANAMAPVCVCLCVKLWRSPMGKPLMLGVCVYLDLC